MLNEPAASQGSTPSQERVQGTGGAATGAGGGGRGGGGGEGGGGGGGVFQLESSLGQGTQVSPQDREAIERVRIELIFF